MSALSPRERQVLELVADGLSNGEIATRLGISANTVKIHLGRAFDRLGVQGSNRVAAVVAAGILVRGTGQCSEGRELRCTRQAGHAGRHAFRPVAEDAR